MSATATTPAPAAAEPAATGPKPRRRLLIVGVAVLALAAAGGYVVLGGDAGPSTAPAEAPVVEGVVAEVGTLTTNLAGPAAHYARVGIALVLREGVDPAVVEERFALVKDAAITEIGRHDPATVSGSDGTEALRAGLTAKVQALYPDGEVLRVVLTELLVQ